jgi:alkylation response protein AidB-like acyl-CoA dehydrogenase
MAATTAVRNSGEWVINGSKMFATNGTLAQFMNAFCLTDPAKILEIYEGTKEVEKTIVARSVLR